MWHENNILLKCCSCSVGCSLSNPRCFLRMYKSIQAVLAMENVAIDQPRFTEYHMETLNVPRHQTADTSPSQADSNLQVTRSNRGRQEETGSPFISYSRVYLSERTVGSAGSHFCQASEKKKGHRN